jgi:hypothetical protein
MEDVLRESYTTMNKPYGRNRVFNNYAGHRPAEPASLSVVATWHTLTRFLLQFIDFTRRVCPQGRVIHPWSLDSYAQRLQSWYQRIKKGRSYGFADIVTQLMLAEQNRHSNRLLKGASSKKVKVSELKHEKIVMLLSDGCIRDIHALVEENLISNVSMIVGYDEKHQSIKQPELILPHEKLVKQGKAWGAHLNEPWHVLVLVAIYIFLSVGLGLPLFGLLADAIWKLLRLIPAVGSLPYGLIAFPLRTPHVIASQSFGYSLVGVVIQFIDAWWFVFLGKHFVWFCRYLAGRPMAARMGKRTIVIVDNPSIHQLTENFCSKLFAQGYSFNTPDVHGASGLDHFVHRFTHRVARGLLLVIGRPDGRLCNLSKSESAVILAAKQAAFIRNPDYPADGSGPEIVTVGHNPYEPSLGLCHNITLQPKLVVTRQKQKSVEVIYDRKRFLDEYIYDRCKLASKPFTMPILRSLLRDTMHKNRPYGAHHIDPNLLYSNPAQPMILDFITQSKDLLKSQANNDGDATTGAGANAAGEVLDMETIQQRAKDQIMSLKADGFSTHQLVINDAAYRAGCNPGARLAFLSRLDSTTQTIEELQIIVQQFYECRIASLERYISYCVMFHAMVEETKHPWLCLPWDPARSQSNLRVATTASPVSAQGDSHQEISKEVKEIMKAFALKLRGYKVGF